MYMSHGGYQHKRRLHEMHETNDRGSNVEIEERTMTV